MGGKYKLLKEILPLFPERIHTFVDLFGGGFNIGVNVEADCIIYNDVCLQVVDLLKHFYKNKYEDIHEKIIDIIAQYGLSRSDIYGYEKYGCNSNNGLSKYNKVKYLNLREDYNTSPNWIKFYTLVAFSFSNQIRFNSKNGFNMPCGKRDYNLSLQNKLKIFTEELQNKNCEFLNISFEKFDYQFLTNSDFVYCDPPYFNSVATYNEQGGWDENCEKELLSILDILNKKGVKFALSNNLKYKNPLLDEWKNKYNIHYLNGNYNNCNYQKKDKSQDIEVLITNY